MTSHILALLISLSILPPSPTVVWKAAVNHDGGNRYELVLSGKVAKDYYVHPMDAEYVGTSLTLNQADGLVPDGAPVEEYEPADYKGEKVVMGSYVLRQAFTADGVSAVEGTVSWSACSGDACGMPEDYEFNVPLPAADAAGNKTGSGSLWGLILEAILWGFLMLLTPCVFPMVPMTVSFFLKQSGSPARGRFRAAMYGLFIVLLYTVPICVIIGLTWALGGSTFLFVLFQIDCSSI